MIFKQIKRNSAVSLLAMNFLDQEKLRPMLVKANASCHTLLSPFV